MSSLLKYSRHIHNKKDAFVPGAFFMVEDEQPSPTGRRYPWKEMNVGDSFFAPLPKKGTKSKEYQNIYNAKARANKYYFDLWKAGKEITQSFPRRFVGKYDPQKNGIRIWRLQ